MLKRRDRFARMVVLLGTLGFHPRKFLAALPGLGEPIRHAVIYTGGQRRARERVRAEKAVQRVTETLEALGTTYEVREFTSPWDYFEIFQTFLEDLQAYRPEEVAFNLTGGPKTMTVAATMACLMHGVRVVYVPEEFGARSPPIELPLLRVRYNEVVTPAQHRVLRAIREHAPASLHQLSRRLRLKNATVTYHVDRLVKLGALSLITEESNRVIRRPRLTPTGEILLLADEILTRRRDAG